MKPSTYFTYLIAGVVVHTWLTKVSVEEPFITENSHEQAVVEWVVVGVIVEVVQAGHISDQAFHR